MTVDFDPIMHDTLWMSVVGQAFIVLGSLIFLTATVGIIRFPDLYTRSSAIATAAVRHSIAIGSRRRGERQRHRLS